MKKLFVLPFLITIIIMFAGCSNLKKTRNNNSNDDNYTETYDIPVEIYTYTDLDELDDEGRTDFSQQLLLTFQASESDKSLTKGIYNGDSRLVSLTFDVNQKKSYISSLKEFLNSDPATMYSGGEYKLEHYSDDSKYITICVSDKETFNRYFSSFQMEISSLIQLQILSGTNYEDTSVTAKIIYRDGTIEEQVLTWKDIY